MTVLPHTPGQLIANNGQYDIPMSVYHSQCCAGPSVSSSGLRKIYLESPADFWATSDLNENRWEPADNDAFTFGRAAHSLLLGDEDFGKHFAIIPKSAPPRPTTAQIGARAEGRITDSSSERFGFWDEFDAVNEGKDYLKEEELEAIHHIGHALESHPIVSVLLDGQAEQSLIWKDEQTGIWLKSRLDILAGTGDFADLKSTIQKSLPLLYRDIQRHGYDMQLGLATMAVENVLNVPFTAEVYEGKSCILLFVHKKPPYHVMPVEVDFDALYWARIKCRSAINTMAECIKTEHWPGPVEGIATYSATYEASKLAEMQADGLLPTFA